MSGETFEGCRGNDVNMLIKLTRIHVEKAVSSLSSSYLRIAIQILFDKRFASTFASNAFLIRYCQHSRCIRHTNIVLASEYKHSLLQEQLTEGRREDCLKLS